MYFVDISIDERSVYKLIRFDEPLDAPLAPISIRSPLLDPINLYPVHLLPSVLNKARFDKRLVLTLESCRDQVFA